MNQARPLLPSSYHQLQLYAFAQSRSLAVIRCIPASAAVPGEQAIKYHAPCGLQQKGTLLVPMQRASWHHAGNDFVPFM